MLKKFIILACLLVGSCQSQEEKCCQMKTVGNVDYYFSSEGEVPSQCRSGCIYHEKNKPDSRFCFAHGNLPVFCKNTGISVNEDFITSTNFPSSYQNNIEASHSISVPKDHTLFIHFIEFDLEYHNECTRDFLKIIDTSGKQLFFGCGNKYNTSVPSVSDFPVVLNTSTSVVITFKSDGFASKQGFKLKTYTSGPSCSAPATGENIDEILAPNSYQAQVKCSLPFCHHSLNYWAYSFDSLTPTLVFRGPGSKETSVVKWDTLKCEFEKERSFDKLMQTIGQFKGATKLVLVTHGWNDGNIDKCEDAWVSTLSESISINDQPELTATIAMCWNSHPLPKLPFSKKKRILGKICEASYLIAPKVYYDFAASTAKVGEFLSKVITSAKRAFPGIDYTYGLGHSLGAHVMGSIYSFGNIKINRISGLDPAGPCFEGSNLDITIENGKKLWGLDKESAGFVDNLHTDGDHYGTFLSMGDIDFFAGTIANAGVQPTCSFVGCLIGCCHTKAKDYFGASIIHKTHWLTAYPTILQENYKKSTAPTIASEPDQSLLIHTGFWATPGYTKRMYAPIFKNSQDSNDWAAICNLADLSVSDRVYCCKCCKAQLSASVAALCTN